MLEALRSFFARTSVGSDGDQVAAWARQRGHTWKREKDGDGFAIEGHLDATPWRLEWGRPQRPYIAGHELRLRMALGLPPDLQMLVMTRALKETLENEAFEHAAPSHGTQAGTAGAEEMRWLALFPKISFAGSKILRSSFAGVSSLPHEGPTWLEGALAHGLERATSTWLAAQPPFLLMTLRGRIYLRLQLGAVEPGDVAAAVDLFEIAADAALRVARTRGDEPVRWTASLSTAWQSLPPERPR
jgi:hypothetical protein